jgi:CHASE1-domain containing sensor protein
MGLKITGGLRQAFLAFVVFAIGIAVTVAGWWYTHQQIAAQAKHEFRLNAERAAEAIERRVRDKVDYLRGLRGLFLAFDRVDRRDFHVYLASFGPWHDTAGLRAVSFGRRITREEKENFERQVRADTSIDRAGYPGFAVRPPGERDEYVVIEYIYPVAGNEAGFGLDLLVEPARRSEIAMARDTSEAIASGPFAATIKPDEITVAVRMAVYQIGRSTPCSSGDRLSKASSLQ